MTDTEMDVARAALYALHLLPIDEERVFEGRAVNDPLLRAHINTAQETVQFLALEQACTVPSGLRGRVLAAVERQQQEEIKSGRFPLLHAGSRAQDLAPWLDRPEFTCPKDVGEFHAVEIERTPDRETVVIWLTAEHGEEVHVDVVERFLILEGTCDVRVGDKIMSLVAGDVITIPLYVVHSVRVTSVVPCKALIQRVAA